MSGAQQLPCAVKAVFGSFLAHAKMNKAHLPTRQVYLFYWNIVIREFAEASFVIKAKEKKNILRPSNYIKNHR